MAQVARSLDILTRDQGVRKENPLLTDQNNKYFVQSSIRTPSIRKEADTVLKQAQGLLKTTPKLGMQVRGKVAPKRVTK